jgi:hypothetical protein
MTVITHEIAHGLGLISEMIVSGTSANWFGSSGSPSIYDTFIQDGSGNSLINTSIYPNPSTNLYNALISGNIWFSGINANSSNGGGRVKIYAPSPWDDGSSYCHLDYNTYRYTSNKLMVYALGAGESIHNPGPVVMGIFKDLGWNKSTQGPAAPTLASPITNAYLNTTTPEFTWVESTDAVAYEIQIDDSSTFSDPILQDTPSIADLSIQHQLFRKGYCIGVLEPRMPMD